MNPFIQKSEVKTMMDYDYLRNSLTSEFCLVSLAATLLGCGINVIAERLMSRDDLKGSPWWMYITSVAFQACILPAVVFAGIFSAGGIKEWVNQPVSEATGLGIIPHAVFISYFLKDMPWPLSGQIIAHHVVCVMTTMISVSGALPKFHNLYLLGAFILEIGSLYTNLVSLLPHWPALGLATPMIMALSNFGGILVAGWFALNAVEVDTVARYSFIFVVIPLCAIRQLVTNGERAKQLERFKANKKTA